MSQYEYDTEDHGRIYTRKSFSWGWFLFLIMLYIMMEFSSMLSTDIKQSETNLGNRKTSSGGNGISDSESELPLTDYYMTGLRNVRKNPYKFGAHLKKVLKVSADRAYRSVFKDKHQGLIKARVHKLDFPTTILQQPLPPEEQNPRAVYSRRERKIGYATLTGCKRFNIIAKQAKALKEMGVSKEDFYILLSQCDVKTVYKRMESVEDCVHLSDGGRFVPFWTEKEMVKKRENENDSPEEKAERERRQKIESTVMAKFDSVEKERKKTGLMDMLKEEIENGNFKDRIKRQIEKEHLEQAEKEKNLSKKEKAELERKIVNQQKFTKLWLMPDPSHGLQSFRNEKNQAETDHALPKSTNLYESCRDVALIKGSSDSELMNDESSKDDSGQVDFWLKRTGLLFKTLDQMNGYDREKFFPILNYHFWGGNEDGFYHKMRDAPSQKQWENDGIHSTHFKVTTFFMWMFGFIFSRYEYGAFLEDDLLVSPYLNQFFLLSSKTMDLDASLVGASAWHDNQIEIVKKNGSPDLLTMRQNHFGGLGWMTSRDVFLNVYLPFITVDKAKWGWDTILSFEVDKLMVIPDRRFTETFGGLRDRLFDSEKSEKENVEEIIVSEGDISKKNAKKGKANNSGSCEESVLLKSTKEDTNDNSSHQHVDHHPTGDYATESQPPCDLKQEPAEKYLLNSYSDSLVKRFGWQFYDDGFYNNPDKTIPTTLDVDNIEPMTRHKKLEDMNDAPPILYSKSVDLWYQEKSGENPFFDEDRRTLQGISLQRKLIFGNIGSKTSSLESRLASAQTLKTNLKKSKQRLNILYPSNSLTHHVITSTHISGNKEEYERLDRLGFWPEHLQPVWTDYEGLVSWRYESDYVIHRVLGLPSTNSWNVGPPLPEREKDQESDVNPFQDFLHNSHNPVTGGSGTVEAAKNLAAEPEEDATFETYDIQETSVLANKQYPDLQVHCLHGCLGDFDKESWKYLSKRFNLIGMGWGRTPRQGYKGTMLTVRKGVRHFIVARYSPYYQMLCREST